MSCLYILEINSVLVASFANIFSQSLGCLFILFMVSFAVQKLISLRVKRGSSPGSHCPRLLLLFLRVWFLGLRLEVNLQPVANDLINHEKGPGSKSFQVGEPEWFRMPLSIVQFPKLYEDRSSFVQDPSLCVSSSGYWSGWVLSFTEKSTHFSCQRPTVSRLEARRTSTTPVYLRGFLPDLVDCCSPLKTAVRQGVSSILPYCNWPKIYFMQAI